MLNLHEDDWQSISYLSNFEDDHSVIEIVYKRGLFITLFGLQPEKKVYIQPRAEGFWFDNDNENGEPVTSDVQEMLDRIKQRLKNNNLKHVNGEM